MGYSFAPKNTRPSLIDLAKNHQLPRHQYMDSPTLDWIAAHRPDLPRPQSYALSLPVRTPCPRLDWFTEPQVADSIHGVRHCARTAVLAASLAAAHGASPQEQAEAVIAAAVHDCARSHDQDDPEHGQRAADWFRTRVGSLLGVLEPEPTLVDTRRIADAIALHDVPYEDFTPQQRHRYERSRLQVDLVKTADALDRYRLPKLKWWPDHRHLRLIPTAEQHAAAFELVITVETRWLAGDTSTQAVTRTIEEGWT